MSWDDVFAGLGSGMQTLGQHLLAQQAVRRAMEERRRERDEERAWEREKVEEARAEARRGAAITAANTASSRGFVAPHETTAGRKAAMGGVVESMLAPTGGALATDAVARALTGARGATAGRRQMVVPDAQGGTETRVYERERDPQYAAFQGLRRQFGDELVGPEFAEGVDYAGMADNLLQAQTTRRGQDTTAATTVRGQDLSATTARRGQDLSASTSRRGQDLSAATAMRGQDLQAARTPRDANVALQLRDRFGREETVKNAGVMAEALSRIRASADGKTGQSDLGLLYAYMKLLDPGSVVRESEFATAAKTGNLPSQIQGWASRAVNGERLPDEVRAGFVKAAEGLARAQQDQVRGVASRYATDAAAMGADPSRVVADPLGEVLSPRHFARPTLEARANQLRSQGKPAAEILRIMRSEGYNVAP